MARSPSWASDACAVEDRPDLRWPLWLACPSPLTDIREALTRLDRVAPQTH